MAPSSLAGRKGLILGLASEHSIAYGCAREALLRGADLVTSCVNEKAFRFVEPREISVDVPLHACDVEKLGELEPLVERAVGNLGRLCIFLCSEDSSGMTLDRLFMSMPVATPSRDDVAAPGAVS